MSPLAFALVRWLCDPARQEELAGDLHELYLRRRHRWGVRRAVLRTSLDLASTCVHQSRVLTWSAREWALVGALVMTVVAGSAGAGQSLAPYVIDATDAAGTFSVELQQGAVLGATVNGLALPAARVRQQGRRLVLHGAADGGRDLEISLTSQGGIRWEGRQGSAAAQETPIDLALARRYFAELAEASARDNGALWGIPLYGPMFFVHPDSRFLVANRPDSARRLTAQDGVFVGTLPDDLHPANTAIEWNGMRWTMVMWPVPSDGYRRRQLGFHELFHGVQDGLRLGASDPASAHLGTRDGRIWTRLEWRALAEALVRKGEERRAALEDALLFRARRRALFAQAAADEKALELNEGLSEYSGLKLSGLPEWVLADRAAVALMERERQESLSRSFAYASGPAYGILLDEAGADWRRRMSARPDLSDLVRDAYRIRLPEASPSDLVARARAYDGDRVIALETAQAERTAALEARLRAALVDGPTVTLPVVSRFSYSFNPNGATPLGDIGTTYESARVTDEWGILTVESGGVLMVRQPAGVVRVAVPAPPNATSPPLAGEGWRLELLPGWVLRPATRAGSWEVVRN